MKKLLTLLIVTLVVLSLPAMAWAQGTTTNPNPAALVSWSALFYTVFSALVAALQETSAALPFSLPVSARTAILLIGGIAQTLTLAIVSGTPWMQAIGAALVTMLGAYAKHGARELPSASSSSNGGATVPAPPPSAATTAVEVPVTSEGKG
jgi:hypothetical protein